MLAEYTSEQLDLDLPETFRDLSLPMGAIDPQRLSVLLQRFREMPREEVSPRLSQYKAPLEPDLAIGIDIVRRLRLFMCVLLIPVVLLQTQEMTCHTSSIPTKIGRAHV